ncbi:MAG TPA: ABC transporter permease [Pyrinomonadaceae bacterium]|nr:ABC transporter permease [Pyrinomonadaceae bacterium]
MNFAETFKLALAAIWAHKLRSFLTLLGMIIGVTAVVVVVSMIQGFNAYVEDKIANIGANNFTIFRFDFFKDFQNTDTLAAAQRRNKELTLSDYEFLMERKVVIDQLGVQAAPSFAEVKRGAEVLESVPVGGATANIANIQNISVEYGRFFSPNEDEAAARVAFIGRDVADKLFPAGPETAIDGEILIRGLPYRVIGIMEVKGTVLGRAQDNFVTVPLRSYLKQFGPPVRNRWLSFAGTPPSPGLYNDAVEEARNLMRLRRQLKANEPDNFAVITPDAITGMRDRIFGPIFIVAIAVPGIALLVGAIVIMNIMLVSVTERTKEIGIRKAIGARRTDVLKQFLVEAVTLSAIGGALGVLLAWLIGLVISAYIFPTYFSFIAVVLAVGVSGGVGVLAGIFPAWKAARLDPIEALRAD